MTITELANTFDTEVILEELVKLQIAKDEAMKRMDIYTDELVCNYDANEEELEIFILREAEKAKKQIQR